MTCMSNTERVLYFPEGKIMKTIICDDEKSTCSELEEIILKYAKEKSVSLVTEVFYSGDTLLDYLKREKINILFLDIELPGKDGVMVGKYIREVLEEENIFLIYISSKENYALQLFQNRPFDFLVKPIEAAKIYHVLDNIYRISGKNSVGFEFQTQNSTYRISYKDILYFQSTGRKINIVNEIEKRIPENVFLRIHKSYLVNKNYVKEFTYEWVKMLNGDVLNISKINRADVRRKILESAADEFKNI